MSKLKHIIQKLFLVFLLLAFQALIVKGQELSGPKPYFIAIIVSDFEQSLKWYQEVLDLDLVNKVENADRGFKQANLRNPSLLIELIELSNVKPPEQRVAGFFKFGITVEDFDAWHRKLKDLEVEFNGDVVLDPQSGKQMIIIKDPDGNRIQFFSQ